jgi:hypothetical protein
MFDVNCFIILTIKLVTHQDVLNQKRTALSAGSERLRNREHIALGVGMEML